MPRLIIVWTVDLTFALVLVVHMTSRVSHSGEELSCVYSSFNGKSSFQLVVSLPIYLNRRHAEL